MFIYNLKMSYNKIYKFIFITMLLILTIILCLIFFRIFTEASTSNVSEISPRNYTNILKSVHENIDNYIGVKFKFTGFVYRVLDINSNQFILARNMIVSSNYQSVVVGFLCECNNAKDFDNDTWVEVTGEIVKGNYHGDMPIVKVIEIKKVDKPNDEFVYPPDENYLPTEKNI